MSKKLLLCGATGRMGTAIETFIRENDTGFEINGRFSKGSVEALPVQLANVACIIDFSLPDSTLALLNALIRTQLLRPTVIGTTGLSEEHFEKMDVLSEHMPILQANNMSPGINFLNHIVTMAPEYFDESYDIDLYECHHRNKLDAPSGTAKGLQQRLEKAYGFSADASYVPTSQTGGGRPKQKIGLAVERSGQVFGEHRIGFTSELEAIHLTHRAFDRKLFAKGAVMALNWLKDQPPGRYSMADIFK